MILLTTAIGTEFDPTNQTKPAFTVAFGQSVGGWKC